MVPLSLATNKINSRPKSKKSFFRWLLLCFFLLLILSWWINLPGYWVRDLAKRALQRHDAHLALSWIDRAFAFQPNDSSAMLLAARANLQLNLNSKANEWLDRAQAIGAPEEATKPYRCMIAAQLGDVDSAEQLLSDSSFYDLPIEANEAVIRAYQFGKQRQRADLILDHLEKDSEARGIVSYHRGRFCEIDEDFKTAGMYYSKALSLQPSSIRAAFRAGICFYNTRDFDRAEEFFRKQGSGPYQSVFAIELANCLWEKNEAEQAAKVIEPFLDWRPEQTQPLYIQLDEYVDLDRVAIVAARIEDALGNREQAVRLLERALAFNHRDFEGRALLIKNLQALGRSQEGERVAALQGQMVLGRQRCRQLRQELEQNPRDFDKLCELAELYWQVESEAEALLAVSEILDQDPNCERALQLQAAILREQISRQQSDKPSSGK